MLAVEPNVHVDILLVDARLEGDENSPDGFVGVKGRDLQGNPARLQPGQIQQIVHQCRQAVGFVQHHVQILRQLLRRNGAVQHGLDIAAHAGHGRAQLVGDRRDEIAPGILQFGQLAGHAVDGIAQLLQLAAAVQLHAPGQIALGEIAHGAVDFADGPNLAACQKYAQQRAQPQRQQRHGQNLGQQVDQTHLQLVGGDVQQHAAHHLAVRVAPGHADGHDLLAQLGEEALHAHLRAGLDEGQLRHDRIAEEAFGRVPAAVQNLDEAGIVADDPDVGVVLVVNVGDLAPHDVLHGGVVAQGAELVQIGHVLGDFLRLKAHLVFVGDLALLLEHRGHHAGKDQHCGQHGGEKRAEDALEEPFAHGVISPRICIRRPRRS